MSFMNALADLLAPAYPTFYMVRSKEMNEAERRTDCFIKGVVGSLVSLEPAAIMKDFASPGAVWNLWKVVSYDAQNGSWLLRHLDLSINDAN
jgi:hypothetical protein